MVAKDAIMTAHKKVTNHLIGETQPKYRVFSADPSAASEDMPEAETLEPSEFSDMFEPDRTRAPWCA
jgi:hypothetical protein